MPWFRFRRRKDEEQAAEAAAALEEAPAPAEEPAADEPEEDTPATDAAAARKRRRRGSRGGRGRRKPGAGAETPEKPDEPTTVREAAPAAKQRGPERSSRKTTTQRSGGRERRRQPARRAPLPEAKRELLISVDVGEQRVALLEDDRVTEVYLERPERRSIAGNIYLGTVDNVLPGMEAAFVEIGLEKNGFLFVDEIVVPELEGKRHGKKITDLIQRGQQVLVQAVKDPMKTKGARLTTEISLPGRFLVYVPNGEGLGVSRRIEDAERTRLKEILKGIAPATGGVIVRTAADGASAEDIERDLVFLQRLWKTIQARAKVASPPELVYEEAELPLRIVRDLFAGDFVAAHVDSDRAYKRIVGYLKKTSPHMVERVHRTKEKEPLFERFGVEQEIASTLNRRVDLPSGGYLIFDYAEAFTVIDVNTGSFVGSRSKSSTQRLEDTIVKNNLEAVKEVVRQLRLRDIGGIIVIDFIDMANPKNRQAVEEALRTELERDRTKTFVVEISPLGLVEMTRQKVTDGPREVMTRKCPTCAGDGIVVSDATVAIQVERRLRSLAAAGAGSRVQAYRIELHPRTVSLLAGPGGARLAALEEATRRRFYLVPAEGHVHNDHFEVLAEGRRDDLAPAASLEQGAEVELKLVEIDLHDATSAVGKLDGHDVVVADAARLVGKKATVRIGLVLDGRAFATLVAAAPVSAPITFESEAEKPTRAPARRKADEPAIEQADDEAPERDDAAAEGDAAEEDAVEVEADAEAPEEGAAEAPKKRSRRGSRGGKRRRKPAGASAEAAAEDAEHDLAEPEAAAPTDEPEPEAPAAPPARPRRRKPRIHVPDDGTGVTASATAEATEPAAVDGAVSEPQPEEEALDAGADTEQQAGGDGAVPRKRTRRGSRGGRNRKKKPAAVNGDGAAPETGADGPEGEPAEAVVAVPAPEAPEADGDAGYVPMSEWIEDFDRRK
ncbi:MAG TPA: Rne/Rng family ribonuclease [Gaiella sp.]|uniref:Rne/Rng family ribonuclease n=1 Tax=Gaiella sp. TaxID=2663207 RepID=UPI002D8024F1|nr:Rne/Rng family ribonuclease [Gaiella sp.]HET9288175.1 Rne/Rng family ribonuclease [Gaiella sp.]